jgi:hypothetical protein
MSELTIEEKRALCRDLGPVATKAGLLALLDAFGEWANWRAGEVKPAEIIRHLSGTAPIVSFPNVDWNSLPDAPAIDSDRPGCLDTLRQWASQGDATPSPGESKASAPAKPSRGKATVAARMIDLLRDPATHTWSCQKFADKLGCGKATVAETAAWKQLRTAREMARQERDADKQTAWQRKGNRPNVR